MEFEKLQSIIAEVLNIDADSLDVFQIIMGIEEEFDIEIPNDAAENISTVADAVDAIKNALN